MSALRVRWVARMLHPERFAKMRERFEEHGNWATFGCRFFAGVRIPGYFIAGTMGMAYGRFVILDFLGVLISVPISIYLGKLFGGQVDELKDKIQNFHLILAFAVISLVLILVVRARRQADAAEAREGEDRAADPGRPAGEPRGFLLSAVDPRPDRGVESFGPNPARKGATFPESPRGGPPATLTARSPSIDSFRQIVGEPANSGPHGSTRARRPSPGAPLRRRELKIPTEPRLPWTRPFSTSRQAPPSSP